MEEEEKHPQGHGKPFHHIRRCLMSALYGFFKEYPYATMELRQLSEDCGVGPKELNWNIVFLEKCGLVELAKSYAEPPFVSPSAVITAEGIELIEDEYRFDQRFPHHQAEGTEHDAH